MKKNLSMGRRPPLGAVGIVSADAPRLPMARPELIHSIIESGNEVVLIGPEREEDFKAEAYDDHIRFCHLPLPRRSANPFQELLATRSVLAALRTTSIDNALVYGLRWIPLLVPLLRRTCTGRVVCIVNGSGTLMSRKGVLGAWLRIISFIPLRRALRQASVIMFQNSDDLLLFRRRKILADRSMTLLTAGSGVNLERFSASPMNTTSRNFLMISRIVSGKGINEFSQAAEIVHHTYPEARFILAGGDDGDDDINWSRIRSGIRRGYFTYVGEATRDEVTDLLRDSFCFVLPSYRGEGVPRSILEALAVGRPVISTDTAGCRDTVESGVNGFLIPPKDVEALARSMIYLINNPDEAITMGVASRIRAETLFDVHKVNREIIGALLEAVA